MNPTCTFYGGVKDDPCINNLKHKPHHIENRSISCGLKFFEEKQILLGVEKILQTHVFINRGASSNLIYFAKSNKDGVTVD